MLGEIAGGVLVGPSLLNYLQLTPAIKTIAELGVLLLVFHAGLEMDLPSLRRAFRGKGLWVGIMGFFIPLALGTILGLAFGFDHIRIIFISLCIAITALPVSVRMLMDLGKLQTDLGEKIIAAAVMNDVASLLILGAILDLQSGAGGWQQILTLTAWSLANRVSRLDRRRVSREAHSSFERPHQRLQKTAWPSVDVAQRKGSPVRHRVALRLAIRLSIRPDRAAFHHRGILRRHDPWP